jgi:hypothetical protein
MERAHIKHALQTLAYILAHLFCYNVFALVLVMAFGLSGNSVLSGFAGWTMLAIGILFTADEEDLRCINRVFGIKKEG